MSQIYFVKSSRLAGRLYIAPDKIETNYIKQNMSIKTARIGTFTLIVTDLDNRKNKKIIKNTNKSSSLIPIRPGILTVGVSKKKTVKIKVKLLNT